MHDETVWLNRHQMAELFDRDIKTIGKHINNTFNEGELDKNSVVAKFATTAEDEKTYQLEDRKYRKKEEKKYISDFDREVKKLLENENK